MIRWFLLIWKRNQLFTFDAQEAKTPMIKSQTISGLREIKILQQLQHPNIIEMKQIVYE